VIALERQGILETLRREAIALLDAPSITSEAVGGWRSRVLAALKETYGEASAPARDFSRIKFDDTAIIDAAERTMRRQAAEKGVDLTNVTIPLPSADTALRRGLHEAVDMLLALRL
jgi:hypothetical protein